MKIEAGKYYRTRDGRKVGPTSRYPEGDWSGRAPHFRVEGTGEFWGCDGTNGKIDGGLAGNNPDLDLIAEWADGPVRTVTRREIVPGVYGRLNTLKVAPSGVAYTKAVVSLEERFYSREDLTEIIDLLAEVREGLELAGALDA